jgi:hypothetical protein
MSDFTFNSSGSPRSTAFQKLVTQNVNGSPPSISQPESGRTGEERIFREVQSAPDKVDQTTSRLSGLEAAVTNLSESRVSLEQLNSSNEDVAGANSEASKASVRDVDAAAQLADTLFSQILGDEEVAKDAQAGALTPDRVERALR